MPLVHRLIAVGVLLVVVGPAPAQTVLTRWDFNSPTPDANTSTGTTAAAVGTGLASTVGGTSFVFSSGATDGGSRDPATGDDSGFNVANFPIQGANNETAGVQFRTSTAGAATVRVQFDQRHTNSSSRFVAFQYTTDGTSYQKLNLSASNSSPGTSSSTTPVAGGYGATGTFAAPQGDTWFNLRTVDLTNVAGVADNPNFGFRIVSSFDAGTTYTSSGTGTAYSSTGTWRFDYVEVIVTPVPEPATAGLLAAAGLGLARIARRRRG